ncbi:cytochrome P450 [Coccomyxa subellipsoidea C-169]|uniref:Cytochrome P450 n=1 Tax=Coccomyxa subellipsoidea (strain C-169) TaxID=574566 RepID=I0YJS5_COCSC|nr:cytochrome P450 [Coccomyxa subellipsoidea C-169]EIE18644.1 cytochrome P450 [Coccomyxa subellipsoidea C-169]|eukprot:XP_005643188.1 cytochrome P450 [Coccomyxa subellipsoidea C-169]
MRVQLLQTRAKPCLSGSVPTLRVRRHCAANSISRVRLQPSIRCVATTPAAVLDEPKEPPVASWIGISFLLNGSDFTRKAVQKHGHVWKAHILGATIYGLAGDAGLKAFYDEKNIKRFPGMSANLEQAAWDDQYNPHYAVPPLDSEQGWQQRKSQFMAGIDSRAAVEQYLQALDQGIIDTIKGLGADGKEFALWDTINSLVLGGLSKAFFGFGLADYCAGEQAMIGSIQTGYTVFDAKVKASQPQKDAFTTNVRYLREALAEYRAHPKRFPGAGLGKYLELAEKLHMPDEEILLDMHQMICVGAYGGVTSSAGCMAFSLATNPEVRKKAKAEIAANLGSGTPTFADMKALPYTYAVLKEALRRWPIVHIVRGQSIQDIVVEGKRVPKDSTVIAALHGTMHDPTVYKEPERFDPERFLPPRNEGADEVWTGYQVVFGAGESGAQHACAGRNTALLTLFVLLIRLLQNWDWELVKSSEYLVTNHFSPNPSNNLKMRKSN